MPTWKVETSDGRGWTIDAPEGVSEADVNAFAEANADSWVNGARYRMEPDTEATAPEQPSGPTGKDYADAVARLDTRMQQIDAERQKLAYGHFRSPSLLTGGSGVEGQTATQRIAELTQEYNDLESQKSQFEIGSTGQTVGGIGGGLAGGGLGALLGSPLGPPGMAIGGILGSILGGAGGVVAGTHLWDIPVARGTREVTDQEAAELIKSRAIEALVWDGAFVLILGPGGRAIGKMTKGAKFLPALKAAAKQSFAWDKLPRVKAEQMAKTIEKRAAQAPEGLATEVSRAIGETPTRTGQAATREALTDLAERTGGRVPTKGEMTGLVEGGERFVRSQAPMPFFKNDQALAKAAGEIRDNALRVLDDAGAYTGADLGNAINTVTASANKTLKRTTGPVFERAAKALVSADMTPTIKILEDVLGRDARSAGRLLASGERASIEGMLQALKATPNMWVDGVQDFISGNKAALRSLSSEGVRPTEFMQKVLNDVVQAADGAYLAAIQKAPDASLKADLLAARKLYRETMTDLFSDTMVKLARQNPEDMGRALTAKGSVTETQELRAALDRALSGAPGKTRVRGQIVTELGAKQMADERARIDAGIVKGFIEKQTQSLDSLDAKLLDPDFRLTLKELLVGKGAANPARGRVVLDELDKALAVLKLAAAEMAPQPGRLGVPGMGGVGAGTAAATVTGDIKTAAPLVILTAGLSRQIGKAAASYMTTGNAGYIHAVGRAIALSRLAGKNAAAAEALRATLRELDNFEREAGE